MGIIREVLPVLIGLAIGLTIALGMGWRFDVRRLPFLVVPTRWHVVDTVAYRSCLAFLAELFSTKGPTRDRGRTRFRAAARLFFVGFGVFVLGPFVVLTGAVLDSRLVIYLGIVVLVAGYSGVVGALLFGEVVERGAGSSRVPSDVGEA